jgi:superfamily I DNA/RNA helicase
MTRHTKDTTDGRGPHLVMFDVRSRGEATRRLATADPGARACRGGSWTRPPRPRPGRVGVWHWRGGEAELQANAGDVLLRFVHPLVTSRLPYCVGFPFDDAVFAPRRLSVEQAQQLDFEDIGTLLRAEPGGAPGATARGRADVGAGRGTAASERDPAALDAAQRAAVRHDVGPARVLAPAGAGKTKTLISRVAELVARGVDPGAILLLAFNRKAAEQFEERLEALGIATTHRITGAGPAGLPRPAGARPGAVHCATFNAFGYRYQKEVVGLRPELDTGGFGARDLMRRALDDAGLSDAVLQPARGCEPVTRFLAALARVRSTLDPPGGVSVGIESCGARPQITAPFAEVHAHYTRRQLRDGRQSFDDQIYLAVADLLAVPAHRAAIQQRFRHILVDEFQDLNAAQLTLVDILSRPRRDLFVVGDDDQLIYGWRHADITGILDFHQRMPPEPWSATYRLETNYRCSRAVVRTSSRLVRNNVRREPKDVSSRAGAVEGAVRFFGAPLGAERAAAASAFLHSERARLGCAWSDLAVLCRYRAQRSAVAEALTALGVPCSAVLLDEETPASAALAAATDEPEMGTAAEGTAEDAVAVCTIHASKGREYHSVVIPDYDCDLTKLGPGQLEEERRVMYVAITRARDVVLLTVDTSLPYVHPFLRELVTPPEPGEYADLESRGSHLEDPDEARRAELALLFPDLVPRDGGSQGGGHL